jgi:hypothetical protein
LGRKTTPEENERLVKLKGTAKFHDYMIELQKLNTISFEANIKIADLLGKLKTIEK